MNVDKKTHECYTVQGNMLQELFIWKGLGIIITAETKHGRSVDVLMERLNLLKN